MSEVPEYNDPSQTEGCIPHPEPPRAAPDRVGSFQIQAVIGSGGMGTVYRAYDDSMRRLVALKVLHPSYGLSDIAQQRFARESWIAGQLEHPNIIRVYTRSEEPGQPYFAMELADGGSLAEHIRTLRADAKDSDVSRTVDSVHVRFLLERFILVAEALQGIHDKGFIHRDIKPHNLLLCGKDKQFKLTDFGIAHADEMTRVTRAGDFIGTIKYMSPELLAAHRAGVDRRTDIYSLGVTLYEALTLSLPYNADTEEKYVGEILAGRVIPARRRNRRLPVDLETVLLKATDHDPERRYQSARELSEDLRAVLEDRPIRAKRPGPVRRTYKLLRRHKASAAVTAIMLVGLGVCSWWFYVAQLEAAERGQALQIMKSAISAKRTPSEIDLNWKTLSGKIAQAVRLDENDSLAIWYHRVSGTFRMQQLELEGKVALFLKGLDIVAGSAADSLPLFALVTDIDMAIDTGGLAPLATAWSYYSLARPSGSCGTEMPLDSLLGSATGLHSFSFRAVVHHYRNAKLYKTENLPATLRGSICSTMQIKSAMQAGLLVPYDATISAISGDRADVIAIADADSSLAQSFLEDTTLENFSVVVDTRN